MKTVLIALCVLYVSVTSAYADSEKPTLIAYQSALSDASHRVLDTCAEADDSLSCLQSAAESLLDQISKEENSPLEIQVAVGVTSLLITSWHAAEFNKANDLALPTPIAVLRASLAQMDRNLELIKSLGK